MSEFAGIVGYFDDADQMKAAIEAMHSAGLGKPEAFMPLPDEESLELLRPESSPVRWAALAGALIGLSFAWWMLWTLSMDYPLIVGGKPFISWPPYTVVVFELTILFSSFGTVAGFLWFARLPQQQPGLIYRPSFSVDRYALYLHCGEGSQERQQVEEIFRQCSAASVSPVWGDDSMERRR